MENSTLQTEEHGVACTQSSILASQGIAHPQDRAASGQPIVGAPTCASVGAQQASSAPRALRRQRFPQPTARAGQMLNNLKVRIAVASMKLDPWIRL